MKLAIAFTNFGPYHFARMNALGEALSQNGDHLIAHEMAGSEKKYPWDASRGEAPYRRSTLFPARALEDLSAMECRLAMTEALDRDDPDAVAICGYARPESIAALRWAEEHRRPAILMSESQRIDRPRVWWREAIKRRRVQRFSSALVGGISHRDYLVDLGLDASRIALGYNAVDNDAFASSASHFRQIQSTGEGMPMSPYFLAVSRFVPEKNLPALIRAHSRYRASVGDSAWPLVLCGGGSGEAEVRHVIESTDSSRHVILPGFLQGDDLARAYAHAGAFVLPSLSEPWGLVANEAASCSLPLLLSDRAGCSRTLVPEQATSGYRFDPFDESMITSLLVEMTRLSTSQRISMGNFAAAVVANWGPARFAHGMRQAIEIGFEVVHSPVAPNRRRQVA